MSDEQTIDGASKTLGRIPVSVVTGFLGSGKTTLIGRALRDPAFGRTAVIVNEFGEVPLDHDLIASSDDSILTLATGCLCCAVQTDLARTLLELLQRRDSGSAAFDRVLIETSGLSDPVPLLQSMMTDGPVSSAYKVGVVVTLVDTLHAEVTLDRHTEARHQVAVADRLLISKTDIRPVSDGLTAALDRLNPGAPLMPAADVTPAELFVERSIEGLSERLAGLKRLAGHRGIEAITVVRDQPLPALALTLLLQALAEHCGARLLRLKGLVAIEEMPGRPAVIHGVRHVVSPPEFLDRWPTADERTRIVLIGSEVPRYFVPRLLDAIETEVREANSDAISGLRG